MGANSSERVEIVNVSVDASVCAATKSEVWLKALNRCLGKADGPRVVFFPPLVTNVAVLPPSLARVPLGRATELAMFARPLRFAAVFFAYPGIGRKRLPWAVMHDRVEEALRGDFGTFAQESGSTVVTTVLADHPRIHWEAWPERGDLYHSVQTIRQDGDPVAALRQRRPETSFASSIDIDPEDTDPGSTVDAGALQVGVVWDSSSLSSPRFSESPSVVWQPRLASRSEGIEPGRFLRGDTKVRAVVVTGACHTPSRGSTTYVRDSFGHISAFQATTEAYPGIRFHTVTVEP
jgi:hypothetical protein